MAFSFKSGQHVQNLNEKKYAEKNERKWLQLQREKKATRTDTEKNQDGEERDTGDVETRDQNKRTQVKTD